MPTRTRDPTTLSTHSMLPPPSNSCQSFPGRHFVPPSRPSSSITFWAYAATFQHLSSAPSSLLRYRRQYPHPLDKSSIVRCIKNVILTCIDTATGYPPAASPHQIPRHSDRQDLQPPGQKFHYICADCSQLIIAIYGRQSCSSSESNNTHT